MKVYSREKTLADCFKHRSDGGLDTILEAIRPYMDQRRIDVNAIMSYAKICRVAQVAKPYLEAIL